MVFYPPAPRTLANALRSVVQNNICPRGLALTRVHPPIHVQPSVAKQHLMGNFARVVVQHEVSNDLSWCCYVTSLKGLLMGPELVAFTRVPGLAPVRSLPLRLMLIAHLRPVVSYQH